MALFGKDSNAVQDAPSRPFKLKRFRIVTGKNYLWAKIYDADTGEELENVRLVECMIDGDGPHIRLDIDAAFEIETDVAEMRYVIRNLDGSVTEWPMPTEARPNPLKRFMR